MGAAGWPEPVVPVQALSQSGITTVPERYVKPPQLRPLLNDTEEGADVDIPVVDMGDLIRGKDEGLRRLRRACEEWGFMQVVNHGVSQPLMERVREVWRGFFRLPVEDKLKYANSPVTYEGYGSRLGVEKDAILDWSDYFFINYMPSSLKDPSRWPSQPPSCREVIEEYGQEVKKLCRKLMEILSESLGLEDNCLLDAMGGEDSVGGCLRANYYPKCPQPHLTLGLSSHSDPGGVTVLLPDSHVAGLQVRRGDRWVTVSPIHDALIVNIGDQIQILSNAIYKSVEHRVIVNPDKDRVSLAFFYNPKSDLPIEPVKDLLREDRPALYKPIKFQEYRLLIRQKGPCGKNQVESLLGSS